MTYNIKHVQTFIISEKAYFFSPVQFFLLGLRNSVLLKQFLGTAFLLLKICLKFSKDIRGGDGGLILNEIFNEKCILYMEILMF